LVSDARRKLEMWLSLPEEARVEVARRVARYWRLRYEREGLGMLRDLLEWLASEDGALVVPYMFKPEFRSRAPRIIHRILSILAKLGLIVG
jgi:hypothetical protein